jgi:hypothetical protein
MPRPASRLSLIPTNAPGPCSRLLDGFTEQPSRVPSLLELATAATMEHAAPMCDSPAVERARVSRHRRHPGPLPVALDLQPVPARLDDLDVRM